ncbi:hypothetical protein BT93_J0186 [Corymbia citriodora subsp. variegata]|nr:hypothetical protein BT93_J0186 [Corymbia citriodora subsp. variegata]
MCFWSRFWSRFISGHPASLPTPSPERSPSVSAVEAILKYEFNDPALLEQALTHPSLLNAPSYERLEFLGDKVLNLVAGNLLFRAHPEFDQGQLTKLVWVNVSTEKLARVAVHRGLYHFLKKRNVQNMNEKVGKFARAVEEEADDVPHGGSVTAPKVLADIVESVAGAIFKDVDSNVKQYEGIFRGLLEPIIGPEELEQQPQPIALLNELYQKQGKVFHIKPEKKGSTYEARAYVDGKVVASCSSEDKKSAKLRAARICLSQFAQREPVNRGFDGTLEIAEAKKKLHDLCVKKKWSKPKYDPFDLQNGAGGPLARQGICMYSCSSYG